MAATGPSGGTAVAFYLPKEDAFIIAADKMVTSKTVNEISEKKSEEITHREPSAQKVYAIDGTMGCAITGSRFEGLNWIGNLSELVAVDSEFIEQKTDKGPNQFDKCFDRLESYRHANLREKDKVEILLAGWDVTKKRRLVHMHNAGYVEKVDAWWIGTGKTYAMTSLHSDNIKNMDLQEGVAFALKAIYTASTEDERTGDSVDAVIVTPNSVQKLDSVLITTLRDKYGDDPLKLKERYRIPSS